MRALDILTHTSEACLGHFSCRPAIRLRKCRHCRSTYDPNRFSFRRTIRLHKNVLSNNNTHHNPKYARKNIHFKDFEIEKKYVYVLLVILPTAGIDFFE